MKASIFGIVDGGTFNLDRLTYQRESLFVRDFWPFARECSPCGVLRAIGIGPRMRREGDFHSIFDHFRIVTFDEQIAKGQKMIFATPW